MTSYCACCLLPTRLENITLGCQTSKELHWGKNHQKKIQKSTPRTPQPPFPSNCPLSHVLAGLLLFMQLCQHCCHCTTLMRTMQSQVHVWTALGKHRILGGWDNSASQGPAQAPSSWGEIWEFSWNESKAKVNKSLHTSNYARHTGKYLKGKKTNIQTMKLRNWSLPLQHKIKSEQPKRRFCSTDGRVITKSNFKEPSLPFSRAFTHFALVKNMIWIKDFSLWATRYKQH